MQRHVWDTGQQRRAASLMDDLLSVDEVAGLFDGVECRLQVRVPRVETLIRELLPLADRHDSCKAVNLGSNAAIDNHVA